MPLAVADRVVETTTTTGTGDLTLAGAVAGFRTFDSALADFDSVYYLIEAVDADGIPTGDWETGVGIFNEPSTLSRDTILASSNAGAAVSLAAGTKRVHLTCPARQIGFAGCVISLTSDLTGQNFSSGTAVGFTSELIDTDGFHESVTNPSYISVDGTKYVDSLIEFEAQVSFANNTAANWILAWIEDDLGTVIGRAMLSVDSLTNPSITVKSRPYQMGSANRYFRLFLNTQDSSIDITALTTWFKMRVIQ